MEFVRDLLVFLHLLGMGTLVGTFLIALRAKAAEVNKGWLHGGALQLITGIALMALAPATGAEYDHIKLGTKLLVLVVIGALAMVFTARRANPGWLTPALGGLVVLNVGLAVFW
ncbi:hypothetical protein [Actinokineospora pegani]|uniref:hypothetical protein n=1 Tax=Actinokineospora pegani TaxID=2654637 RepID=UPI0012E9F5FD|nr:hypothetical protein [Actinokineospora pegani]